MTNAKKYLLAAVVGTALTLGSAAPAMAGDHGPDHGYGGYDDRHRDNRDDHDDHDGSGCTNHGGAYAEGSVSDSPGFLSGNLIQVVIDFPINICGNRIG
ncbi:hypothetical protein A8W25_05005 [Streptomyces sp. ERV7]|uniref:chaplin n=1 Tax=Streptomyces sp. ERV7 TaxID=1322334 RepID=UPI0007F3F47C|nr:chaplin [Streptomyces sp. ERV7]OAR27587.1 hypothetical protein A8W25_05005 [Streptomyces sp. ERV7]